MKFNRFNRHNTQSRIVSENPQIHLSTKNGNIYFNSAAIKKFELKEGKKIEFLQSSDEQKDWFIVFDTPQGFVLNKRHAGGFTFSSIKLVTSIVESINVSNIKSLCIPIATEQDPDANAYALLTNVYTP